MKNLDELAIEFVERGPGVSLERPPVKLRSVIWTNIDTAVYGGFKAGYSSRDAEVRELREALKEAIEGMETMVDDIGHCEENRCVPTKEEYKSAKAYLEDARKAHSATKGGSGE